jgi:uncharacterized delta-60 repeat protein
LKQIPKLHQVLLYDQQVEHVCVLLEGLNSGVETVAFGADSNVTGALNDILARPELERLDIVAHGEPGAVLLGANRLDAVNWASQIPSALPFREHTLQINFWSCRTGEGDIGMKFIQQVASSTKSVVNASSTLIGHEDLGGNWDLDVMARPQPPFHTSALKQFDAVLSVVSPISLAYDSGAFDGVTNDGTVHVTLPPLAAGGSWQYSSDGGTTWNPGAAPTGGATVESQISLLTESDNAHASGVNSLTLSNGSNLVYWQDSVNPMEWKGKILGESGQLSPTSSYSTLVANGNLAISADNNGGFVVVRSVIVNAAGVEIATPQGVNNETYAWVDPTARFALQFTHFDAQGQAFNSATLAMRDKVYNYNDTTGYVNIQVAVTTDDELAFSYKVPESAGYDFEHGGASPEARHSYIKVVDLAAVGDIDAVVQTVLDRNDNATGSWVPLNIGQLVANPDGGVTYGARKGYYEREFEIATYADNGVDGYQQVNHTIQPSGNTDGTPLGMTVSDNGNVAYFHGDYGTQAVFLEVLKPNAEGGFTKIGQVNPTVEGGPDLLMPGSIYEFSGAPLQNLSSYLRVVPDGDGFVAVFNLTSREGDRETAVYRTSIDGQGLVTVNDYMAEETGTSVPYVYVPYAAVPVLYALPLASADGVDLAVLDTNNGFEVVFTAKSPPPSFELPEGTYVANQIRVQTLDSEGVVIEAFSLSQSVTVESAAPPSDGVAPSISLFYGASDFSPVEMPSNARWYAHIDHGDNAHLASNATALLHNVATAEAINANITLESSSFFIVHGNALPVGDYTIDIPEGVLIDSDGDLSAAYHSTEIFTIVAADTEKPYIVDAGFMRGVTNGSTLDNPRYDIVLGETTLAGRQSFLDQQPIQVDMNQPGYLYFTFDGYLDRDYWWAQTGSIVIHDVSGLVADQTLDLLDIHAHVHVDQYAPRSDYVDRDVWLNYFGNTLYFDLESAGISFDQDSQYEVTFGLHAQDLRQNVMDAPSPFEFIVGGGGVTELTATPYGFQVSADAVVTVSVDGAALNAAGLASRFVVDTSSSSFDVYTAKPNAFDGLETVSVDALASGMESARLDFNAQNRLDTSGVTLRVEGERMYVTAGALLQVTVDGDDLSSAEIGASFTKVSTNTMIYGQSIDVYQPVSGAFDGSESIDVKAGLGSISREVTDLQFDSTSDFLDNGIAKHTIAGSQSMMMSNNAVGVDVEGRIIVASTVNVHGGTMYDSDISLTRYTQDGELDLSFGTSGHSIVAFGGQENVTAVAIDDAGRILVSGNIYSPLSNNNGSPTDNSAIFVAAFDEDGQLDTMFGTNGSGFVVTNVVGNEMVASMALAEVGGIVLAGTLSNDFMLVRYDASGVLDSDFGDDGVVMTDLGAQANSLSMLWSSSLVAMNDGGWTLVGQTSGTETGNPPRSYSDLVAVRYDAEGSLEDAFGNGGIATIFRNFSSINGASFVADTEDGIVFAANSGDYGLLGRLDANGELDATFGDQSAGQMTRIDGYHVNNLMIDDQGDIFAAGLTQAYGSNASGVLLGLTHFSADGVADTDFGGDGLAQTPFAGWSYGGSDAVMTPQGDIVIVSNINPPADRFGISNAMNLVMVRYDSSGMLDTEPYVPGVVDPGIDDVVSLAEVVADPGFDLQTDELAPQTGPLGFDTLDMSEVAVVGALDLNLGEVLVEVADGTLGDTQVLSFTIGTGFDEYVLDGHGDGVTVFGRADDSEMVSLVSAGNNYIDLNDASNDEGVAALSGNFSSPALTVMDLAVTEMDIVNYGASEAGLTVDLGNGINAEQPEVQVHFTAPASTPAIANDILVHVEGILGSKADDDIQGNALSNLLSGNAGNDVLDGGSGNDLLIGGSGGDILQGGTGMDILVDLAGMNNFMSGGAGNDVFVTGDGLAVEESLVETDGSFESAQHSTIQDFELAQEFTSLPGRGDLAKDSVVFRVDLNRTDLLSEYTKSDIKDHLHLEIAASPNGDLRDRVLSLVFGSGDNKMLLADITLDNVAANLGATHQLYAMFLDDTVSAGMDQGTITHALGFDFNGDNVLTVRAAVEQQRLGTLLDSRGDDVLLGGQNENANVLVAGAGNDLLSGGRGADVYEYHVQQIDFLAGPKGHAAGYFGKDVITDWGNRSASDADVLYLEGVDSVDDLDFTRIQHAKEGAGGSLQIHVTQSAGDLTNTGDIVLFNQYSRTQTGYRIENLVLDEADGQRHTYDLGKVGSGKAVGGGDIISMDGQNNAILVGSTKADEFQLNYEGHGALNVYLHGVQANDRLMFNGINVYTDSRAQVVPNGSDTPNELTVTLSDGTSGISGDVMHIFFLDGIGADDYLAQHSPV